MSTESTSNGFFPEARQFSRQDLRKTLRSVPWPQHGKVVEVVGTVIEACIPNVRMGTLAEISVGGHGEPVLAEVVGFREDRVLLLPFSPIGGIAPGSLVKTQSVLDRIPVGDFLLGNIIDPFMRSMTARPLVIPERHEIAPLERAAPNPLERNVVREPLGLGIRAMDGLLTMGDGQRVGVMAGSGVGKSVMMGMIAKGSEADINVIGLIGERGREVREFIENDLGPEGLARSVLVVVTGDQSPLMKIRAAKAVTSIAEYFSSQGKRVLMMMDSLTRVAMAQREIGLAVGEPPTTKGYTPSVFSLLPRLLERSGPQAKGCGAISALYTVLVDGDDFNDPIADAARSILDGHVNLSRDLAAKGHFPAIDVRTSASRVMNHIVEPGHWQLANRLRGLLGVYHDNFDLVQIGAYVPGTNPKLDEAMALMPAIEKYLKQDLTERATYGQALMGLKMLFAPRKD